MHDTTESLFVSTFGRFGTFGEPGARPTVVCLHGIESHGLRYVGLATRLGPGFRVVAPDLRGHGRSTKVGPWTVAQHIEDLLPLLTGGAVLLGHSYGGLLAWELARAAPDSLSALVLVDPAINVSAEVARVSQLYEYTSVGHSWPDEAAAFADFSVGRTPDGLWSAALDAAVAVARDDDGKIRTVVAPDAVAAGWRQMQESLRPSGWHGPTLLIEAGREHGNFVSAAVIALLRAQLGDALSHVVVDATHTIPTDYPELLAAAVEPFLSRVAAASE